MFVENRKQSFSLQDSLSYGKDKVYKFGSFLTEGVSNLVKKNNDPNKKSNGVFGGLGSKISSGIYTLGSKTKSLATNTSKYIMRKSNAIIQKEDKHKLKQDIT